jgi:plasmid stabilization system protein ParE
MRVESRPYRGLRPRTGLDGGERRMTEPRFVPSTPKDDEDAFDWYHPSESTRGKRFEQAVDRVLADIVEAPDRWSFCDRQHRQHRLQRYPCSIVYRLVDDTVMGPAVAQTRRRFWDWKRRR